METVPLSLWQAILSRSDFQSMCRAASSCRLLKSAFDQELPYVESLCFQDVLLDNRSLKPILCSNVRLRQLKLNCGRLDDDVVELIVKPSLDELVLYNCESFSDKLCMALSSCKNLRRLSLDLCPEISRSAIHSFQHFKYLESLSLTFPDVSGAVDSTKFSKLVFPMLKVLEVGVLEDTEVVEIINMGVAAGGLERLSLALVAISDTIVQHVVKSLPSLLELELEDEPLSLPERALTNSGIEKLEALSRLRRLSLVRMAGSFQLVTDMGVFMFTQNFQQLESLRLGGFSRITDASCQAILQNCPKLHTLELVQTNQLTDLACHNLLSTRLDLTAVNLAWNTFISDDTARYLVLCENLVELNLRGCSSIGDAGLRAISTLRKLRTLLLDGSDVSDFGLYALADGRMPLTTLSLKGCSRVTDDGIVALMAGESASRLESLDLSFITKLTDHSVLALVQNQVEVKELWLRDCNLIGDASVEALACKRVKPGRLELLDLWNCRKITRASIQWFRKPYFPGLRRLGLPQLFCQTIKLVTEERPFTAVHWLGAQLDRKALGDKQFPRKRRYAELEWWYEE